MSRWVISIAIFLSLLTYNELLAQKVDQSIMEARVRKKCLDVVNELSRDIATSDFDRNAFYHLFRDGNVKIVNDIMLYNQADSQITMDKYLDTVRGWFNIPWYVQLMPYDCKIVEMRSGGRGLVEINTLKFIDNQKPRFSRIQYSDTFDIKVSIEFDYLRDKYKITDIESNKTMGKYVVLDCAVQTLFFRRVPLVEDSIRVNSEIYHLNLNGRALFKRVVPGETLEIECDSWEFNEVLYFSYEEIISSIDEHNFRDGDANSIEVTFKKIVLYSSWGFSPILSRSPLIQLDNDPTSENNGSFDVAMNLGWRVISRKKYQISLGTGLSYGIYNYDLQLDSGEFSIVAIDGDNYEYERIISWKNLREQNDVHLISVPLYLNMAFHSGKWSPFVQFGVELPISFTGQFKNSGDFSYKGYYHDLFELCVEDSGTYDFGQFSVDTTGTLSGWKIDYLLSIGAGVEYHISKRSKLVGGVFYRNSLQPVFKGTQHVVSNASNNVGSITTLNNELYWRNFNIRFSYKYYF